MLAEQLKNNRPSAAIFVFLFRLDLYSGFGLFMMGGSCCGASVYSRLRFNLRVFYNYTCKKQVQQVLVSKPVQMKNYQHSAPIKKVPIPSNKQVNSGNNKQVNSGNNNSTPTNYTLKNRSQSFSIKTQTSSIDQGNQLYSTITPKKYMPKPYIYKRLQEYKPKPQPISQKVCEDKPQPQPLSKMVCGDWIDRQTLLKVLAQCKQNQLNQLRCPSILRQNVVCNSLWSMKDIHQTNLLTQTQIAQLETVLNENWIKLYTKSCPKCKSPTIKNNQNIGAVESNKVNCPLCKRKNFCYLCSQDWKEPPPLQIVLVDWQTLRETKKTYKVESNYCGNQKCYKLNYEIKNAKTKAINMYAKNDPSKVFLVHIFEERTCPFCRLAIQNNEGIKHKTCNGCSGQFCWICLAQPSGQKWPCGKVNQYCGQSNNDQKAFIEKP